MKISYFQSLAATVLFIALLSPLRLSADVTLSEAFPDANFVTFLKGLAYQQNKSDIDAAVSNGSYVPTKTGNYLYKDVWTEQELALIKVIDLSGRGSDPNKVVRNLSGIKNFVNLDKLIVSGHQLTSLDVSGMQSLRWVEAGKNHLTSINIEDCPTLKWLEIHQNSIDLEHMSAVLSLPNRTGFGIERGTLRVFNENAINDPNYPEQNKLNMKIILSLHTNLKWMVMFCKNNSWSMNVIKDALAPMNLIYIGRSDFSTLNFDDVLEAFRDGARNAKVIQDSIVRKYIREVAYIDNSETIASLKETGYFNFSDYAYYVRRVQEDDQFSTHWSENFFWPSEHGEPFVDEDAFITDEDASVIRNLYLSEWNEAHRGNTDRTIYSLKGIEHLTSLERLYVTGHALNSLDVSNMPNLRILHCHEQAADGTPTLTSLNVSNCGSLHQIYCDHNLLTELDVSTCGEMRELRCNNNPMDNGLDVTKNSKLVFLDCYNCQLPSLDVTQNPYLERLYCYETRDGEATGDPAQTRRGRITGIDLSQNPELWELRISNLPLASLDLSNNRKMKILFWNNQDVSDGKLQNNLQYLRLLQQLSCYADTLASLDVSMLPDLAYLDCHKNLIKTLDLSKNPALTSLNCGDNQVGVDVRNVPLPTGGNLLTSLDVSKNVNLIKLYCAKNNLVELDLRGLTQLDDLNYAEQVRDISAENNLIVKSNNESKNLYYLRMDNNRTDTGNRILQDRMAETDHNKKSNFDISLVDMTSWNTANNDDEWTPISVYSGNRNTNNSGNSSPRRAATEGDLNRDAVIGDILVLTPAIETDTEASGTVVYKYDVRLEPEATATDEHSYFTLNWTSDPEIITGITDLQPNHDIVSVTYHNAAGMVSDRPFDGVNIVVTRFQNGATTVAKQIK